MLGADPVQPDDPAPGVDLAVDDLTFVVAIDATGPQAKRIDQKVVNSLDVFVHEQWDDPLRIRHAIKLVEDAAVVLDKWDPMSASRRHDHVYGQNVAIVSPADRLVSNSREG